MPFDLDFTFATTPSGDYTNELTLTLAITQPGVNAAPAPVWFEVTNITGAAAVGPIGGGDVYNEQFHDIIFMWDFDDAANATPRPALNMPNEWKDINKAYGRGVAHVYNDHGSYTATCYAYEPATKRFGSATIPVSIGDPDTAFPTTQTIIFDPDDNADTSAYPSADVRTTWSGVQSARDAFGYVSYARILIAPGITLADTQLAAFVDWSNIRIGPLDPDGAKPTIGPMAEDGTISGNGQYLVYCKRDLTEEVVLYGLNFVGAWDSTTETGKIASTFFFIKTGFTGKYGFTLSRCDFDGYREIKGIASQLNASEEYYNTVSECTATNWQNYGMTCGGNTSTYNVKTAVIGCSFAQHENALSGGSKNELYNNHGPLRDFGSQTLFVSVCDMFSRDGWSAGGTGLDGLSLTSDQACLRVNTSSFTDRFANVERVAMEGFIWMENQTGNGPEAPGNYVFDKVLQVIGSRSIGSINTCRYGGTTFRNFLGVKLAGQHGAATNHPTSLFYFDNDDGDGNNGASPIKVYNTTFVDLRDDTDTDDNSVAMFTQGSGTQFTDVTVENNIDHQPNRGTPVNADAPIDVTTAVAGFAPRHKGMRYGFLYESGTLSSTVSASGGTFTIAYADVKDTRYNQSLTDNGTVTDQAYWTALSEDYHRINIDSSLVLNEPDGHITVTFGASEITITNNTADDWDSGATWVLSLDRQSLLPAWDGTMSSVGKTVPTGAPTLGSDAINSGDTGLMAYDDFSLTERPATGNVRGARLA